MNECMYSSTSTRVPGTKGQAPGYLSANDGTTAKVAYGPCRRRVPADRARPVSHAYARAKVCRSPLARLPIHAAWAATAYTCALQLRLRLRLLRTHYYILVNIMILVTIEINVTYIVYLRVSKTNRTAHWRGCPGPGRGRAQAIAG